MTAYEENKFSSIQIATNLASLPRELLQEICKKDILEMSCGMTIYFGISSTNKNGFPQSHLKAESSWRDLYIHTKKWNTDTLSTSRIISNHARGVTSLCLDDRYLFSGSHDNTINVHSRTDFSVIGTLKGHKYTIWALASDGYHLYSGSNDHTIKVWNLESLSPTSTCTHTLTDHESKIFGLEIKDNLLFSSGDKIVKVWDKNTLKPLQTLEGHGGGVNAISVMDSFLITGASDKTVRIWDVHSLECLKVMDTDSKILSVVATDKLIFTGHDSCMIKVWDSVSHKQVAQGTAHNWEVWQLALAGGYLFSGSFDHKIVAWDMRASFSSVHTFTGHRSFIHALTADSEQLFSGSADKSIRVWSNTKDVTPA